ncbi:MAG TPA: D-2-hydroxyacid dehydrogenase [Pirellulaceae bacterium]|jgi:glycerate dehydrogenase
MKNPSIVVLDGYCLNPGDLSWEKLEALGACAIFERTPPEQLAERVREADIVLTNKVPLRRELLAERSRLKYIGVTATGYNIIDVDAARDRGIVVTNVPTYGTMSVAQMVLAHLLNLTQRVGDHAEAVREGRWASSADWCFWDFPLVELQAKTMGIVGYGRIGRATAQLARAFGMNVIAHNRSAIDAAGEVRQVDLDSLFRESDIVSLHCPLTPETAKLVNRARLALMQPTAFLINTSRGGLVDENALSDALNRGQIAGAGLDVMDAEPPAAGNPLFAAKNCYITPHIAWATLESRQRLLDLAVENVAAFLAGQARNVVS